jgi:DNA-binding CsgD family transcriptional regulator
MTDEPSHRKRGRPPHPDILTPREWQVRDLLRHDLTNEQIAQRLDISFATAKYHVAEIISKLGVQTREEAAAWRPAAEQGRIWRNRALGPLTVGIAAIAAGAFVIVVGIGTLAWGILQAEEEYRPAASSFNLVSSPTPVIGSSQQALDLVLDNLRTAGILEATGSPDVTVEEMLYGEAAELGRGLGANLTIRPDDYVCPENVPSCGPYPGEPADERGWFMVIRGVGVATPGAAEYFAWVGEDGGMGIYFP